MSKARLSSLAMSLTFMPLALRPSAICFCSPPARAVPTGLLGQGNGALPIDLCRRRHSSSCAGLRNYADTVSGASPAG